jgi:hypothetical protein
MLRTQSNSMEEQTRIATIAAIRVALDQLGVGTAPENVVRHLRRFDLNVRVADVEAIKADLFLSRQAIRSALNGDPLAEPTTVFDLTPDEAWREAETTATPTLHDASALISSAGSVEAAKHTLDVADQQQNGRSKKREGALPPDDVPPVRHRS